MLKENNGYKSPECLRMFGNITNEYCGKGKEANNYYLIEACFN